MSFDNNPNTYGSRTGAPGRRSDDENWTQDPNQDTSFSQSQQRSSGQPQGQTWDSSQGGDWNSQQSGLRDPYSGNTSDMNTPGAGGDFGSTGRQSGRQSGQQFDYGNQGSQNQYESSTGPGGDNFGDEASYGSQQRTGAKPSMGERVKGTMEKATGRVSGNQDKVERGEERRTGGSQY
ncbi:unnamed protein product [Somion occarium]|uniref:CsbD-like domain-containing protein n=1 Tax=Somion occarium TaxID=3059160 RepID=A0ABP1DZ62_9APHY